VELLLVLGMLVVLAALAAPSFQGMLKVRRLESGADQLRAVLRQARREAMEQGIAYRIDLLPETGKVWLRPAADPIADSQALGAEEGLDSETDERPPGNSPGGLTGEAKLLPPVREQSEMPPGIRIVPSDRVDDWLASARSEEGEISMESPATAPATENEDQAEAVSSLTESEGWVPWFEFYPDGSARSSAVLLVDESGRFIETIVDEITGDVEISSLRDAKELDDEASAEDWSVE
jgi:type II secretory pathway pseudopilin PulG